MLKSIFWHFGSRTVLSVCFSETLGLYVNHQSNVWTMTKEPYNLYAYFVIAIFFMQFYSYLKLKMARRHRGEVPFQKKRKHITYFTLFKTALTSEVIPDTLNCANPILHEESPSKVFLTTLLNHFMTLILIYRASKPIMFG